MAAYLMQIQPPRAIWRDTFTQPNAQILNDVQLCHEISIEIQTQLMPGAQMSYCMLA